MKEDKISNLPRFKKIQNQLSEIKNLKLKLPIIKLLGVNTKQIEEAIRHIPEMEQELAELIILPDEFNDTFSDQGWIFNDLISVEVAKEALKINQSQGLVEAELFLADYYSPEWVENKFILLKFLPEFKERVNFGEKALEDYKAGRYYSSVLLTILLIDGWVNDLNIVDFQRKGFYSEESKLIAWDSITAHSKGLVKLQKVFSKRRSQTQTEKITIPYRNGIVHGMDLGFDNRIVAAKNWAALFCVRDWVLKVRNDEIVEPIMVHEETLSIQQTLEKIYQSKMNSKYLENWEPSYTPTGINIPEKGDFLDYPENTPIRTLVEFLYYWRNENFGYMTKLYAPMYHKQPHEIKKQYCKEKLVDFKIVSIYNKLPWATNIQIKADLLINDSLEQRNIEFKIICNSVKGDIVYIPDDHTIWGILDKVNL